ncbi:MBL fold metallo-hydrolase [Amycolatopsis magusensis]|uniref:MBL fold metallo-hydrolase n=1 Tax=Amycolatopsis magusensis TaxID=882444 RepID=UPI0024A9ED83|nr:MBL fold metallo-hydrolase [Amycolatopsis magusensis]MDI5978759.1 MBL fold metallo-hydrolase [Amycolatopsis magusensis]
MQFVHFGHSCVLAETDGARILFDPGTFSRGFEDVRDLDAVLITHQHFDHLDGDRLPALLKANPGAKLIIDPGSQEAVEKLGLESRTALPGDTFTFGGTEVDVVGGHHAEIHRDLPAVPNVGYLLAEGAFYHPGDALFVPDQQIDVLGLPTAAPWLKASEGIDFLRAVSPRVAVPIHEKILAMPEMMYGMFKNLGPEGTEVRPLNPGEPVQL